MIRYLTMIACVTCVFGTMSLNSEEDDPGTTRVEAILSQLSEFFPNDTPINLQQSPIGNLYTVKIGSQVFYVSDDGKYLINGDLYDTASSENLTESERENVRIDYLNSISQASMITFAPPDYQHTITIFTDIDCGYCRKFHEEIEEVLDEGIRVQYVFFPRSGPETDSWYKAQKVWCSDNRQKAITKAKRGEELSNKVCADDPVQDHYNLGLMFNVQGTPTMLTDKGEIIVGYMPAATLRARLDSQ